MSHIFNPKKFKKLESPERYKVLPPEKIMSLLALEDQIVADVGCGIGYFSFPFAKVAQKVYAVDISDIMIEELDRRNTYDNIESMLGDFKSLLPDDAVDLFFTSTLVHELDDLAAFTTTAYEKLRIGGQMAYLDFQKIPLPMGPPVEKKVAADEIVALFESLSMSNLMVHNISDIFYLVVATK